jgi:hypothetical protein
VSRAARGATRAVAPALALLACAALLGASRPLVTPPPTPRPLASTDTLFADDFSQGTSRWTFDQPVMWSVRFGSLCADLPDAKQVRSFAYAGAEEWGDYAVDLDMCQMRGVDKGVVVHVRGNSGVAVDVRGPGYQDVVVYRREIPLGRARVASGNGRWIHLRVECRGGQYTVSIDGEKVLERGDARAAGGGRIALPAYTGGVGECTIYYDNVVVTRLAE